MNIGQLLGGAGVVGQGMRAGEDAERTARQNQLIIEEQNRAADLTQRLAGLQMPSLQPINVAQYTQQFTPGSTMPMGAVPDAPPALLPGQQPLLAGVQPSQAGAGRGIVNPSMVGQPQPPDGAGAGRGFENPPLIGQPQPQMSPQQLQRERDRIALLRVPTAALDVAQAPAAAGLNLVTMAGEQIINIGGRLVNAVTGADVAPTDVRGPRFSMTPFTDRLVTAPEQALAQPPAATTATAATAATAAAPAQPTKRAQSFDNKVTPYDAVIQQSAVQYGIDPVVFKRLIGTESSFNPTAVSPRGAKFGLGIAQIAAVHGLSRKQMLDPDTAIPFAAQLFSQYVQQAGGDYEQAIQKYKGATSEKGQAAMSKPIGDILSGLTLTATPAAAPAAAPGAAPGALEVPPTHARNMEMAEFYLAKPESIPYELQQVNQMAQQQAALLTQQRNETAQLAQVYMRSGTQKGIDAALRLRDNIVQLDASLLQLQQQVGQKQMYLQGMQGLRELAIANDPRRLAGVLTRVMGAPVGIQPRPDGKYNYFVNGKQVQDGVSPAQLASMALREFSPEARTASAQSAQLENELALKRKYGDAMVNAMRDIQKAMIDGEYKIAEEVAKQLKGELTIDTSKGVAYFRQGNRVFVINPEGEVKDTPLGKIALPPTARGVVGLNMGR